MRFQELFKRVGLEHESNWYNLSFETFGLHFKYTVEPLLSGHSRDETTGRVKEVAVW